MTTLGVIPPKRIRNRRLAYLKTHQEYLNDESIRGRMPELYREYVEQYQSESEITRSFQSKSMVERVYYNLDSGDLPALEKNTVEYDTDDEDDPVALHDELIKLAQESFLDGRDDFDYSQVDRNQTFDDLVLLELDAQDRYFDED